MAVKYSYIDFFDHRILYREFTEDLGVDDLLISFKEILDKDMLAGKTCGVITDLRGVRLDVNPKVFKKISSFFKENPEYYNYKLGAITDSPTQVVLATIVGNFSKKLKVKPFSTYQGCFKWMTQDIVE